MVTSRKGIAYTLFTMLFLSSLLTYIVYNLSLKEDFSRALLPKYNGYILKEIKNSLERDFPRSVNVAWKRALVTLINNETYTGNFYDNVEDILYNLSLYGKYSGFDDSFMTGSSIMEWINKFYTITSLKNIHVKINILNASIYEEDYLSLKACYNISYRIEDFFNGQGYIENKYLCTPIKLNGFEDPYITINSYESIISSFELCNSSEIKSNDSFYGIAYIPKGNDLSGIADKEDYVLVVDDLSKYIGWNGFRGYILRDKPLSYIGENYAYNVTINLIKNQTFVIVSNGRLWITNTKLDERPITCYFPWGKGMNFLERLKGKKEKGKYPIATIISLSYLPPELNPGGKYMLDVELFGS